MFTFETPFDRKREAEKLAQSGLPEGDQKIILDSMERLAKRLAEKDSTK
ncbi:hypothetical protein FF098_014930 [Parvularcula flava]|uniref:Uncharacterized protein n=1 Tax=Aquisalinus luteolus TaxID=1566827 RepID=A0A8J3EVA9_9PROT|nr:hypothetical protein [Aquisalinus luteolus]NHK29212.1 hypothetical protein [Aquisalinus luteolus]GGH99948.1 hypothetical protein GCM10011355_27090 [Aquisalinus luteolus]